MEKCMIVAQFNTRSESAYPHTAFACYSDAEMISLVIEYGRSRGYASAELIVTGDDALDWLKDKGEYLHFISYETYEPGEFSVVDDVAIEIGWAKRK